MSQLASEVSVLCPSCWQKNTLSVDLLELSQSFIEDCTVCCNPMLISTIVEDGELVSLEAEPAQ